MSRLIDRLGGRDRERLASTPLGDYLQLLSFGGGSFGVGYPTGVMPGSQGRSVEPSFFGFVEGIHKMSGVVAAATTARALLVSQLRFKWRSQVDGRLWGNPALEVLERPGVVGGRPRLLFEAETHVSYSGSAYFRLEPFSNRVSLMRPDWVDVLIGSRTTPDDPTWSLDAEIVGYAYYVNGDRSRLPDLLPVDEVAPWCPEPDPTAWWRGTSWVQSVLSEIQADGQATEHTSQFFANAATPQVIFELPPEVLAEQASALAEHVRRQHEGGRNAYRSLFVGGGAQAKVVGSDLADLDLRHVHGGFETRVAQRSRVPAVILGVGDAVTGGSSLNAGNYQQTRRLWSDTWFTPVADGLCASLERIVPPPDSANELSFDPAAVMFLQEDQQDAAAIRAQDAQTIRTLVDAGYEPGTCVDAVLTGDFTKLRHSGLFSVQLQEAGAEPTGGTTPEVTE